MTDLERLPAERRHFAHNIAQMLLRGDLEAYIADGARRCGFNEEEIRILIGAAREIAGSELPLPEIRAPWSAAESEAAAQEILTGVKVARVAAPAPARTTTAQPRQAAALPTPPSADALAANEEVSFTSSRWSSGNHLFPARLVITPESVSYQKSHLFGKTEETIALRKVKSVGTSFTGGWHTVRIMPTGRGHPIVAGGLTEHAINRIFHLILGPQTKRGRQ